MSVRCTRHNGPLLAREIFSRDIPGDEGGRLYVYRVAAGMRVAGGWGFSGGGSGAYGNGLESF